jgi:hypothetical protein
LDSQITASQIQGVASERGSPWEEQLPSAMILTPRRRGSRPRRERIAAHNGRNDPAQLGLVVDRRPAILKEAQKRIAAGREKGALEPDSERSQLARLPHFLLRKASLFRQMAVPIVFSEEDAEQYSVTGSLHGSHPFHRIEVLHPADGPINQ